MIWVLYFLANKRKTSVLNEIKKDNPIRPGRSSEFVVLTKSGSVNRLAVKNRFFFVLLLNR